jgi:hypothetical protein
LKAAAEKAVKEYFYFFSFIYPFHALCAGDGAKSI